MNKKVITLCAAALLFGGAGVNNSYAAAIAKNYASVDFAAKKTPLYNGMKFYLGTGTSALLTVNQTPVKLTESGNTYSVYEGASGTITENATAPTGTVFEVRNLKVENLGVTFELWANGYQVALKTSAHTTAVTSSDKEAEITKVFSVKYSATDDKGTTNFTGLSTAVIPSTELIAGVKPYTVTKVISATELLDYTPSGVSLSFDVTNNLVGNVFADAIPVDLTVAGLAESDADATFFFKGTKEDVAALKNGATEAELEKVQVLTLGYKDEDRYSIDGKQAGEGYKLIWKKGTFAKDTTAQAAFSKIVLTDYLNSEDAISLEMKPSSDPSSTPTTQGTAVYIQAVTPSASDNNSYVTSVLAAGTTKFATAVNPSLGANSFLPASVLLKNEMNVVNIYFTSNDKSQEGSTQTEYHKYLVATSNSAVDAMAADDIDFSVPETQWVVANFDGKYTYTLVNRATGASISLKLQANGEEGGYKVVSATGVTAISNLSVQLNTTSVKFNSLSTTKNDGYVAFSENQMKNGVYMTLSGQDAYLGSQKFYAVAGEDGNANKLVGSLKDKGILALYPERVKGQASHTNESVQGKEDYLINVTLYAYLKDNNVAFDNDTLVVPTYVLRATKETGDEAKYLNANSTTDIATNTVLGSVQTEVAVAKLLDGSCVLKNVINGTTLGDVTYAYSTISAEKVAQMGTVANGTGLMLFNTGGTFNKVNFEDVVVLNPSLAAQSRHASFNNALGSINYKLNSNNLNEGILSQEAVTFWLDTADVEKETPSFFISQGVEGSTDRMFMFNATDSLKIFDEGSAQESYNEIYQLENAAENVAKVIFRPATLVNSDTLSTVINGKSVNLTKEDLNAYKFNITLAKDSEDEYVISTVGGESTKYVYALNGRLGLGDINEAMVFTLGDETPTSNESVSASEVKVIANNGSIVVKNAAGKNVVVSTILGQVVANEVLTSDNATINVPAGIVVVAVEGESFKVNVK